MTTPTCCFCGADESQGPLDVLRVKNARAGEMRCVDRTACDLRAELRDVTAERRMPLDCGQRDVCATPPGCMRHWEERVRDVIAERDALRAKLAETTAAAHQRETDKVAT